MEIVILVEIITRNYNQYIQKLPPVVETVSTEQLPAFIWKIVSYSVILSKHIVFQP